MVLRNDRSPAFDEEATTHLGSLRALSLRLAPNRIDAEDLVQDTYLHALRASNRFTPGTNLKAWLRTILTNLARNRRRDRLRARVHANEEVVAQAVATSAAVDASAEQRLLSGVIGSRLQSALESMPKDLRDAVWLRDVEGLSYAELAERLRIPPGTVMSRISRGRRSLHDRLVALDAEDASSLPGGRR